MATLIIVGVLAVPFLLIGGGLALFWKTRRRRILRGTAISYAVAVLVVVLGIGPYIMAWWLVQHGGTRQQDQELTETPADYSTSFEEIVFSSRDGLRLSGWFIPPAGRNTVLVYTHGLFRNRLEMLPRAMAAVREGYGALLYDSRSHGKSERGPISLGYLERNDVLGAMEYVQRRYQDAVDQPRIVLVGISMGAVATLQAAAESKSYAALILDSPFSTLRETVAEHAWLFFKLPRYTFPALFLFWFEEMTGVDADQVDSHEALRRTQPVPLLLIASEGDVRIGAGVARSLHEESRAAIRKLKVFGREVGHGAAARFYPEEYSRVLLDFLNSALVEPIGTGAASLTKTIATTDSPK